MSYRLEIRASALADIAEAAGWYNQKESGLGSEFEREVIEALDALANNPLMYRVRHTRKNVRWKLLDRFPLPNCVPNHKRPRHSHSSAS